MPFTKEYSIPKVHLSSQNAIVMMCCVKTSAQIFFVHPYATLFSVSYSHAVDNRLVNSGFYFYFEC
jgi:hypothetical protein